MRQHMKRFTALVMMIAMLVTMFPTGAFAQDENDPSTGAGTETKITGMTLSSADGAESFDLLADKNITLDGYTSYTLTVSANLNLSNSEAKHMKVTLPEGMKFVGLDEEQLEGSTYIEGVTWTKGKKIEYGTSGYQPDNGTVDITFASGVGSIDMKLLVQPDLTFFPPSYEDDFSVDNAVTAELYEETSQKDSGSADIMIKKPSSQYPITIGAYNANPQSVTAGMTFDKGGANVIFGYHNANGILVSPLVTEATITFSVPDDIKFVSAGEGWSGPSETTGTVDGTKLWTFTINNVYARYGVLDLKVKVPDDAQVGAEYPIILKEIEVQFYGDVEGYEKTFSQTLWTLMVLDENEVNLYTNNYNYEVYNFTENGNLTKDFSDYNQLFGGFVIRNDGISAIKEPLIYEAQFDNQDIRTITAVAIPCGYGNDGYLPTSIYVRESDDKEVTLTKEEIKELAEKAEIKAANKGFAIRAEDIGLGSIEYIKVELPGLPEDYNNTGGVQEGANNPYMCYSNVWGKLKPGVDDGATAINKYRINEKDDPPAHDEEWVTSTTTVVDETKINGAAISSTITVDEQKSTEVSPGETMHIVQRIKTGNEHQSYSDATLLVDPVVYIMEPSDMTLSNVSFTDAGGTIVTPTSQSELTQKEIPNIPEGWTLHEYSFDDTVLGWWDGDWNSPELRANFDYIFSRTAKTASYNMQDLVFYKSGIGMAFGDDAAQDKYNLNDGKDMGLVELKTINVYTNDRFEVAAQIKMTDEKDWYEYNSSDPSSIAVFKGNEQAEVKITVVNNTSEDAHNVIVYVPIPKKGTNLGSAFGMTDENAEKQFDMFAKGVVDSLPDGWTVQYGNATGSFDGKNIDAFENSISEGWKNQPFNDANVIKISLGDGTTLEAGAQKSITLQFGATGDADQSNRTNYFKSWYRYDTSAAVFDTETEPNFACSLQNGELSGTVYVDSDKDGQNDVGENGKQGVAIEIWNKTDLGQSGKTAIATTTTKEDGTYSFDTLPSNVELVVKIFNPGTAENPYRFSTKVASSTGVIGTDVAITGNDQTSATAELGYLTEAKVINAGLTEPYTVTLQADNEEHGTVYPGTVKVFSGETIGKNQSIDVQGKSDWKFSGNWYLSTDTEKENPLTTDELKAQKITGDVTYIAEFAKAPAGNITGTTDFELESASDTSVTINEGGTDASGAGDDYVKGATVIINAGTKDGFTFNGWTVEPNDVKLEDASSAETSFTMPAKNVTVTANWTKNGPIVSEESIKVTPVDIIIYMGGKPYEGSVVNEDGTLVSNQNAGLPEPGLRVELPDELADADVTSLEFKEKNGNRTWHFEPYDNQSGTEIYKLVPAENQAVTRVQFTDPVTGNVVPSDEFTVGLQVNTTFKMELYKGPEGSQVGDIVVVHDNKEYAVDSSAAGYLTVRGTTDKVSITSVATTAPSDGKAGAVADAGTTYTINDSEVAVTDGDVSLLFDDIINSDGNDRTTKLQERADEFLQSESSIPAEGKEFAYEFKYLDLVDANNGNAWVTASQDLTIYWPLPEGADAKSVEVLHFKDLHRNMTTGEIEDKIEGSTVETIEAKVEGNHVTFEVGSGGFSPFALVWETAAEQPSVEKHTITASAGNGGTISPAGAVTVDEGKDQTFTITANSGYSIADVVVDGKSVGAVESYTFDNVTEDHTINVTFERDYTPPPYDPGDPDPEPEPDDPEPDEPDTPDDLNTVDHFSYVVGYEDGTVMPQKQITRAEVATIFYRLLKEDVRDENTTDVSDFSDVKSSDWYGTTVATLADMGIVKGYEDGTFRPNAPITRAEFAAIATRFFDETGATYEPGTFTDVTGSEWFAGAIMDAVNLGLIGGYEDGTVRPNNNITRAEACAIVNRTLGRVPDADHLLPEDEMKTWPDNPESAWFYADMQEATNGHEYEWITEDGNKVENWTDLLDKEWNDR